METHDIEPDCEFSLEQGQLVSKLTVEEVHAIDLALIPNTNEKWRKVAMVIAKVMLDMHCRIEGMPDIYYSHRIKWLVGENKLEARGDLPYMRTEK
ncbi:MAG: DUF3658 domain-containing protein [Candidatus Thiodiazotropha sp.]